MSGEDDNRAKLALLADAIIEDVIATSDVDILAEIDSASIEQARIILIEVKTHHSRRLLTTAKAQLNAYRAALPLGAPPADRATVLDRFEKLRRADSGFNQKITLAARNGKAPTDNDKDGLIEDWADLQKLDEQDS
jgi:hypothetical protein